ncbi:heavy-metal-associated domain-containing protein [Iamia sp. SCSIO 61187]|uniref:heavy-metal-associated domain-containing protein n=1 Tax=Iamia sp. SCSIO 61187 TaxID=2722752 RepID=UPI001C633595|nr:cation transporter [Iamia sp. SCSIO 61187]QYG94205.1 heavy-metal-associated domain-containing protein [Iamia sp. SCSIO 61187]
MTTTTVNVSGMTCGHCVQSVKNELAKVPGVDAVEVDLAGGKVEISSSSPIDDAAIAAAVDEAGYEVSS